MVVAVLVVADCAMLPPRAATSNSDLAILLVKAFAKLLAKHACVPPGYCCLLRDIKSRDPDRTRGPERAPAPGPVAGPQTRGSNMHFA